MISSTGIPQSHNTAEEGRIIREDEIDYCEITERKIYLNLTSGEAVDYYERIENLETKLNNYFFHRA